MGRGKNITGKAFASPMAETIRESDGPAGWHAKGGEVTGSRGLGPISLAAHLIMLGF
jgi:hypothetical protein